MKKTWMAMALWCAAGSVFAGQQQAIMTVSLTIAPVACPEGVTAPSCAPFIRTTALADSYSVATPALTSDGMPSIRQVEGKVTIVTLTY